MYDCIVVVFVDAPAVSVRSAAPFDECCTWCHRGHCWCGVMGTFKFFLAHGSIATQAKPKCTRYDTVGVVVTLAMARVQSVALLHVPSRK